MFKSFVALLLISLLAAMPAQAGLLKELYFEGVIINGADFTGNVFTPAPALLAGKAVTGRFVFDVGSLAPAVAFGATHADYDDPLHPAGGCYGPCTTPFMSAFITIDGHTHEFENAAQPRIRAPVQHTRRNGTDSRGLLVPDCQTTTPIKLVKVQTVAAAPMAVKGTVGPGRARTLAVGPGIPAFDYAGRTIRVFGSLDAAEACLRIRNTNHIFRE